MHTCTVLSSPGITKSIPEGLVPLDSNPSSKLDTFVTLSDEEGHRLAKARTIYETLNPRKSLFFLIPFPPPNSTSVT